MKDLAKVMSLPQEEREAIFEEEKKIILAMGGRAKAVLLYLTDYFETQRGLYQKAFEDLPITAELEHYQTVHFGLKSLADLEAKLNGEIKAAERVSEPEAETNENKNLNI